MSQNDFTLANQSFPAFRADLNSALQALASNNSGGSAPSTTFANMWWYDTSNNIMYIRNEDNDAWIKFAELDQANDKFVLSGTLQLDDGTVSAPALTFNSDTNMGIYRGGTDILKFVTAGTDAITINASQQTTFAGNIDVTGTATTDRLLSIDTTGTNYSMIENRGASALKDTLVLRNFSSNSGTGAKLIFAPTTSDVTTRHSAIAGVQNVNNNIDLRFYTSAGSDPVERMRVSQGGDISFYEDTGSTPKFFWDSSEERLGIGTVSPGRQLEITGTSNPAMRINNGSNVADIGLATSAGAFMTGSTNGALVLRRDGAFDINFGTNGQNRAIIDSGGNLLVGTTNSLAGINNTDEGISLRTSTGSASSIAVSRDTGVSGYFNRNSDGDILSFRKDGSAVGSIGVLTDRIYLAGANEGVAIDDDLNAFIPTEETGGARNNASDLGANGAFWRDLYLGTGIYFGTASANNKLDDYEEGTFTPTLNFDGGTTGIAYSSQVGLYTKVGRIVTVTTNITLTNKGSSTGNAFISGMPFTASSTEQGHTQPYLPNTTVDGRASHFIQASTTDTRFVDQTDAGGASFMTNANFANNSVIRSTITYFTS